MAGPPQRNVVLDCGGGTIVAGWGGDTDPVRVVPNMVAKVKGDKRTYVGDEIDDCKDVSSIGIRRPFDRGYVVSWASQREVWDRVLSGVLGCVPQESGLLLTEPPFSLPAIEERTDQVVFEDLGFRSLLAAPCAPLALAHHNRGVLAGAERAALGFEEDPGVTAARPAAEAGAGLVVDCGFSFTHATPVFDGRVINHAIKRVNIGGKAVTNLLKETVSFRSINMMEETHVMEDVKERLCFISQDLRGDLLLSKQRNSPFRREYVLPDGVQRLRGYVRDPSDEHTPDKRARLDPRVGAGGGIAGAVAGTPRGAASGGGGAGGAGGGGAEASPYKDSSQRQLEEQVLVLNNERFTVPEAIFRPADIGLSQAGLAEAMVQAVSEVPAVLHGLLWSNVLLTGGCVQMPGFKERLERELRPLVPDDFDVVLHLPPEPAVASWRGGSAVAGDAARFAARAVSRQEYEEQGSHRCRRRMAAQW